MYTIQEYRTKKYHYSNHGRSADILFVPAIQPPTMLDCDSLGTNITLQCAIRPVANTVTFYWTQNVSEAGVSGTAILPGDTSDNYQVDTSLGTSIRYLSFTVSESTLGYYWCEISNAVNVSLRPSTIIPVCPPINSSQMCDQQHIIKDLHHLRIECAEENSPTVISRPPLPTSCAMPTSLSTLLSTFPSPTTAVSNPPPTPFPFYHLSSL